MRWRQQITTSASTLHVLSTPNLHALPTAISANDPKRQARTHGFVPTMSAVVNAVELLIPLTDNKVLADVREERLAVLTGPTLRKSHRPLQAGMLELHHLFWRLLATSPPSFLPPRRLCAHRRKRVQLLVEPASPSVSAALIRRKMVLLPHRVLGIEAWLQREAAMMPTASQTRPAMGFTPLSTVE